MYELGFIAVEDGLLALKLPPRPLAPGRCDFVEFRVFFTVGWSITSYRGTFRPELIVSFVKFEPFRPPFKRVLPANDAELGFIWISSLPWLL